MGRSVEIATIDVNANGCTVTTANGQAYTATPGDSIRLSYEFEDDFVEVLEELQKRPKLP